MAYRGAQAEHSRLGRGGVAILAGTAVMFVAVGMPVVWRGAPLADDFNNCLAPREIGLDGFLAASWDRLGMVRPARILEILVTTGVCQTIPFGVAIAVPLVLTMAMALLVRGLLRDLGASAPWPDVGGAAWLLQPLGTEAALWPAALHVPLGLAFALAALRLYRRRRHGWAALATLAAAFSVEQVILALPVAAGLLTPASDRRRAAAVSAAVVGAALTMFALWPGSDPRLHAGFVDRVLTLAEDPTFYVAYPAVGLGLHSIPLATRWTLPWSVVALAGAAAFGMLGARRLPRGSGLAPRDAAWGVVAVSVLVVLANVPVVLAVPRQGSPRLFSPTWLILVVAAAELASRLRWRRPELFGAAGGMFAAGAVLSLALSASVRLVNADFTEHSAELIAATVPDGGSVAVCGVRRTVTEPAPRGAFAVHDLIYEWAAEDAVAYYTGRRVTFELAGELWQRPCPDAADVDAVVMFDQLVAARRP
ncbi:MAG: hypothetical protein M3N57_05670 [Actinomycetota bacterium]|nr:hypothetical protein [Actinomycetota bacterium]